MRTDRDGNIFEEVRATAGETMTFYAWIGRRNGDDFDEDSVDFSKAEARSDKGPSNLLVTHDVPVNAWQIEGEGGELIVDMDRRSSVEFTIQLQDEIGASLEREGVVIDIEVDSREILVDADNVSANRPDPDYRSLGRDSRDDYTVVTDRDGEATFELEGPSRDERLDKVTIETDCCTERIDIAWSEGDPVLVSAKPSFNFYQYRSSDEKVKFTVDYNLYDQYGNDLRGHTTRYTGRQHEVSGDLEYDLYIVAPANTSEDDVYGRESLIENVSLMAEWSRGRLRATLERDALGANREYFIVVKPVICTNAENDCTATDKIEYAVNQVVWVVEDATDEDDFDSLDGDSFAPSFNFNDVALRELELYSADNKFRTFFKLWSYDTGGPLPGRRRRHHHRRVRA